MHTHSPAASTVLAPVSPQVAQLLHLIQGEAIQAAEAASALPAGSIVLATQKPAMRWHHNAYGACSYNANYNETCRYQRRYGFTNPVPYFGTEIRRDADGRLWERDWDAVVDDFGNLVEVQ